MPIVQGVMLFNAVMKNDAVKELAVKAKDTAVSLWNECTNSPQVAKTVKN